MKLSFPIDEFLKRTADDSRLLPTHISLFMAVFYYSNEKDGLATFQVCRRKLMQFSRIKSISTYHKCMNDLVAFGHLIYEPSYDPIKGSKVAIICKKP